MQASFYPKRRRARFIVSQAKDVLSIDAHTGTAAATLCNSQWRAIQGPMKKGPPGGRPFDRQKRQVSLLRQRRFDTTAWEKHQGARRIGERAHDVERSASAVGLLQRPVAHMQLQPQQHAMI